MSRSRRCKWEAARSAFRAFTRIRLGESPSDRLCLISSFSNAYDPAHVSRWEGVHFSTTQKLPALVSSAAIHQLLYFLWRSRPEAGDVAIEDQAERYQWYDVGEEQVGWRSPEYHRRVQECQRSKQEARYKTTEGARLEFENTVSRGQCQHRG